MPFDSNGIFSLTSGYQAVSGQVIQPSQHNPPLEDLAASGLSLVLVRDGRAPMTGALNMNSFKITNLLTGSNANDAVNKAQMDSAVAAAIANMKWRSRFIGEIVYSNTALTGSEVPPSTITDTVWIELTSGLTGVGAFNEGKLTGESISGSGALLLASAAISYASSPMIGQTVRLLNTEQRILRPSTSPNTLQNDQFQGFRLGASGGTNLTLNLLQITGGGTPAPFTTGSDYFGPVNDGTNGTPRAGTETRMKNVGVKAYMRIA